MDLETLNEQLISYKSRRESSEAYKEKLETSAYGQYIRRISKKITHEYGGQIVTKGWLKGMDILHHISFKGGKVFFNAELPGGFVFASNHYTQMNSLPFDWLIASWMPMNRQRAQKPLEDIYGIMAANKYHSLVGEVETSMGKYWIDGDLTRMYTAELLSTLVVNSMGRVNLYTGDGGVDVEGKEAEQELLNMRLIYNEFKTGILCLDIGGTMVVKFYTAFNPEMRSLLAYVETFFMSVEYYKPPTSSPYNSEQYFIGRNFKGPSSWDEKRSLNSIISAEKYNELVARVQSQISTLKQLFEGEGISEEGEEEYNFLKKIEKSQWIKTT